MKAGCMLSLDQNILIHYEGFLERASLFPGSVYHDRIKFQRKSLGTVDPEEDSLLE